MTALRNAIDELEKLPADVHWFFARGRVAAKEPLYGIQLFDSEGGISHHTPLATAEHDDPLECVRKALREANLQSV